MILLAAARLGDGHYMPGGRLNRSVVRPGSGRERPTKSSSGFPEPNIVLGRVRQIKHRERVNGPNI